MSGAATPLVAVRGLVKEFEVKGHRGTGLVKAVTDVDLEIMPGEAVGLVGEAAAEGAQIVLLPEAFVSGYPKGHDFGARVGSRTPEGREVFRRYHDSAVDVPGPDVQRIGEIARAGALHLVLGVIERDGGTLYCTALFFGPDGALLGKHRKLVPTASERLIWGRGDGSTVRWWTGPGTPRPGTTCSARTAPMSQAPSAAWPMRPRPTTIVTWPRPASSTTPSATRSRR